MKSYLLALTLLSISTFVFSAECPDLSGKFEMHLDSCSGSGYKSSRGWPLPNNLKSTVEITQQNCELIHITYTDSKYVTPLKVVEEINLKKAKKIIADENNGLFVKFFDPSERVTYGGATLKASETSKIYLQKNDDGIYIKSSIFMKGFYNYLVPVLDKDTFECSLKRI